jgi:4'-phosphopantetheinyl transferase
MAETILHLSWTTLADFGDRLGGLLGKLPDDERERAERFRVESARRRFVLARTLLRRELSSRVGRAPDALVFGVRPHGKPHLVEPVCHPAPTFNLSHSGDLVVLAVAEVDVGADVESLRPVPNAEKLARRFFSPAECRAIAELDGAFRDHAFLRVWTQKEAYLKGTGLGVGMRLREVETEPDPAAAPRLIAIGGDPAEAVRWKLHEVEIPGAVCTVASLGDASGIDVIRRTAGDLGAC